MRCNAVSLKLPLLVVPILLLGGSVGSLAQENGTPASVPASGPELVTAESIQGSLDRLKAAVDLDDGVRTRAMEAYTQALEELRRVDQWVQKMEEFDATIASAPDAIKDLEAQLAAPLPPVEVSVPEDAILADFEQQLTQAEAEYAAAQAAEATLRQRIAEQQARRRQVPELSAAAQARLDALRASEGGQGTDSPEVVGALAALQLARGRALEAELYAYVKETASQDIRSQLLTLQHDVAVRQAARQEKLVTGLRQAVTDLRTTQARAAEEAAQTAVLEAAQASPLVREQAKALAASIRDLSGMRTRVLEDIQQTEQEFKTVDTELARLQQNYDSVEQRVTAAGLTNAVGYLLRRYRSELPDVREHERNIRSRAETISETELIRINLREERFTLSNLDNVLADMMATVPENMDAGHREELSNLLMDLLRRKRDNLDAVLQSYDAWFDRTLSLDAEEQALVALVKEFRVFIDERILWIRSTPPVGIATLPHLAEAVGRYGQTSPWLDVLVTLYEDMSAVPPTYLLMLLVLLILVGIRRPVRLGRESASEAASKAFCTSFTPTFEVLIHCVLLALPGPVLMWFLGWRLSTSLEATALAAASGVALMQTARWYFLISLARQVLRPRSLGDAHFDWPTRALRYIRLHLGWLLLLTIVTTFVIVLLFTLDDEIAIESAGRLVYAVNMAGLGLFLHLLLRQQSPVVREWIAVRGSAALQRARRAIHFATAIAPLVFLALAGAGYFYTALRMTGRFYMTMALILSLILVSRLVLRWLLLTKRRLAMDQARKRRAAVKARAAEDGDGDTTAAEETLDLAKVDVQTQRLLRSVMAFLLLIGLWYVWVDELPAINILNRVELWSSTEVVTLANIDPANEGAVAEPIEQRTSITLAHLVLAVLVGVMTLAATRNLPGLLEIALLQRMNLAAGERYAVTAVVRYVIGIAGAAYAFTVIGVGWTKVQWLVAALGVGLGFGLQEIFGNFISGLILLFERPIRVGDVVTVNGVTGTVSQIRIRATTIRDFDQKELIVPNKEFVVSQVVNWTLSDSILRVIISVGVAYGSDVRQVRALLLEVAHEHPRVLADPQPLAHFVQFAESALSFELRVYIPGLEHLLEVNNDIRTAIADRFAAAGIEIAFPQRDIHIRSIQAALPEGFATDGERPPAAAE